MTSVETPIRVLSVIPGRPEGASMIFARRQSRSIACADVDVVEFYLLERLNPFGVVRELLRLRGEIGRLAPDLVHAHYGTTTAAISALAAGRRPLVITYRGSDLNASGSVNVFRSFAGRILSQVAALRASHVVCVSEGLRARLWWRRQRTTVMPSGVDTERFYPRSHGESREALGFRRDSLIVVLNCGRNPWVKNLELAEASMAIVQQTLPEVEFVVMRGDWDPDRVPLLLAAADCLLVTSRQEGSPNIVREALATGLPVVSVDVGDVAQWLNGVPGCRIVNADVAEVASAVVGVLQTGSRVDAAGIVESCSQAAVASRLREIYRSVLNSRSS